MGSSVCDRYRVGAVAGNRFDAAVSFAINGDPGEPEEDYGGRNADAVRVSRR